MHKKHLQNAEEETYKSNIGKKHALHKNINFKAVISRKINNKYPISATAKVSVEVMP